MPKLILVRHLESQWNMENRFTGWVDVPLCKAGIQKAPKIAGKVFQHEIDVAYSSPLLRNQNTLVRILEVVGKYPIFIYLDKGRMKNWGKYEDISEFDLPVYISESLNERYYGKLQGLNKDKAAEKYGKEKVRQWRRGFDVKPPGGESLKETIKRTLPFYQKYIAKDLKEGKNVLVVASHNALRSIVKAIENISDKDIVNIEMNYGEVRVYDFDQSLKLKDKQII